MNYFNNYDSWKLDNPYDGEDNNHEDTININVEGSEEDIIAFSEELEEFVKELKGKYNKLDIRL